MYVLLAILALLFLLAAQPYVLNATLVHVPYVQQLISARPAQLASHQLIILALAAMFRIAKLVQQSISVPVASRVFKQAQ